MNTVDTDEAEVGRREEIAVDEGTSRVLVHDGLEIDDELGERFRSEEVSVLLVFADEEDESREEGVDVASRGVHILRVYVDHMVWRALMLSRAYREDAILRTEEECPVTPSAQDPSDERSRNGGDEKRFGAEERGKRLEADVCSLAVNGSKHGTVDAPGEASEAEGGGVCEVVRDRDTLEVREGEDVGVCEQLFDCTLLVRSHRIRLGEVVGSGTREVGVSSLRCRGR